MHGLAWFENESVDLQEDGVLNVALIATCRFPLFGRGVACYARNSVRNACRRRGVAITGMGVNHHSAPFGANWGESTLHPYRGLDAEIDSRRGVNHHSKKKLALRFAVSQKLYIFVS